MAVTVDLATENVRTGTTSPHTFSHAGAASGVKGVLFALVHGTSSTDHVTAASYGGVALTRIQRNVDTATEPGAAEWWFLGSGVPQGTQTVSYTPGATTDDIHAVAITLLGGNDLEVIDQAGLNDNIADPSVVLFYSGRTCMAFGALYGGGAAPSSFTPNANCVTVHDHDLGAFYSEVIRQTTAGSADFSIGGTSSNDDVAFAALAVSEIVVDRRGIVTWAEFEVPNEPRRGVVTFAEFEVPPEPRRGVVTWAEFEVPPEPRRGVVTWAEFEVPPEPRRGIVTWAELEVPGEPRRAVITWVEFETPELGEVADADAVGGRRRRKTRRAEAVERAWNAYEEAREDASERTKVAKRAVAKVARDPSPANVEIANDAIADAERAAEAVRVAAERAKAALEARDARRDELVRVARNAIGEMRALNERVRCIRVEHEEAVFLMTILLLED